MSVVSIIIGWAYECCVVFVVLRLLYCVCCGRCDVFSYACCVNCVCCVMLCLLCCVHCVMLWLLCCMNLFSTGGKKMLVCDVCAVVYLLVGSECG